MNEKLKAKGMPMVAWFQVLFHAAVVQECVHVVLQGTGRCLLEKGKSRAKTVRESPRDASQQRDPVCDVRCDQKTRGRTDQKLLARRSMRAARGRNIICNALHTSIRAIPSWHGHDVCIAFADTT